jgi:hypothetical protein
MKVTDKAIEQFETAIKQFDSPIAGIRVFAGSGCCGPAVELSLVEKAATGDVVINIRKPLPERSRRQRSRRQRSRRQRSRRQLVSTTLNHRG